MLLDKLGKMWKSWTANGTMRIIGQENIILGRNGTSSLENLTKKQDCLRNIYKWLISQLVENHDGVRRQVVIPAEAGIQACSRVGGKPVKSHLDISGFLLPQE